MRRDQAEGKDSLVLAREEIWTNPERACAFALIDIAQSLRDDHRAKVLNDENVPIPGGLPASAVTESDVPQRDHDVP